MFSHGNSSASNDLPRAMNDELALSIQRDLVSTAYVGTI
jgi:hypothetical protein